MRFKKKLVPALAVLGFLWSAACDFRPGPVGPTETFPVNVDLGTAERSKIELNMAAGELNLRGSGGDKLLQGSIEYNMPEWKPDVHTSVVGSSTDVTIRQPASHRFGGHARYVWNLEVNKDVLLDVTVNCGAGQNRLELGNTKLRSVSVHIGAGQVDLDLRGHPTRDYDVAVHGGVGQATVRLPQDIGIWAQAHGGIGHIEVRGLTKKGGHWESAGFDEAKVNVRVQVEGGIGQIEILAE
jgi:N-terminal domain of toast_rack, DUF2154